MNYMVRQMVTGAMEKIKTRSGEAEGNAEIFFLLYFIFRQEVKFFGGRDQGGGSTVEALMGAGPTTLSGNHDRGHI